MLQPSTGVNNADSNSAPPFGHTPMDDDLDAAINSISARVFRLTLTDDGLDPFQSSKLWSSREEFQRRANEHCSSRISVPSICDVIASLARLTPHHTSQQSQTPEVSHCSPMPLESPSTLRTSASSSPMSTAPYCPTARDRTRNVSNGKHDRRTAAAHKRLNAIKPHIDIMSILLVTLTPTPSLQNIRKDALDLKEALDNINRREPSVHDCKQTLITTVEMLLSTILA